MYDVEGCAEEMYDGGWRMEDGGCMMFDV